MRDETVFQQPMTLLGDLIYMNATPVPARLAGNTTSAKQFLSQTGTGSASAAPAWGALVAGDIPSLAASIITSGQLAVAQGGTGVATASANTVFSGPTSGGAAAPGFRALVAADVPSLAASVITSGALALARGGTALDSSGVTDGQLLIGQSSDHTFGLATITGTANQIIVTNTGHSITLTTPQNIGTGSSPTFAGLTLSSALGVAQGGTGLASYTTGDVLYASGSTTIAGRAAVATGSVLISQGTSTAPVWSASPTLTTSLTCPLLTSAAAAAMTASPGAASGTNTAGASHTITSGQGTGTGTDGTILFQVAPVGSTGSSANALTTVLTIAGIQNTLSGTNYLARLSATFADGGTTSAGTFYGLGITPTLNYTAGTKTANFTGLLLNQTHTSAPSGTLLLMDLQLAGVSKCKVDTVGHMTLAQNLDCLQVTGTTINGSTAITANAAASTFNKTGNVGSSWVIGQNQELITLSTSGTTSDSVANLLPANSWIFSVDTDVTVTITTATDWRVGDGTTAGRFSPANSTLTAGTSQIGITHANGGVAAGAGIMQTSAAKVRITTTGTPGAGKVRAVVNYMTFTAPTS